MILCSRDDGKMEPMQHEQGVGVLHVGQELHGAMPVISGHRTNLIIWFRSSDIRNKGCPMCGDTPDLETIEVDDDMCTGDGFTIYC